MIRYQKTVLEVMLLVLTGVAVLASANRSSGWVDSANLAGDGTMLDSNPQVTNNFRVTTTPATDGSAGPVAISLSYEVTFAPAGGGGPRAFVTLGIDGEDSIADLTLDGSRQTVTVRNSAFFGDCDTSQACSQSVIAAVGAEPPFGDLIAVEWDATVEANGRIGEAPPPGFTVTIERI